MIFDQEDATTHRPLIGEILVKRHLINPTQLNEALELQKKESGFLGEILVKLGYLEERDIVDGSISSHSAATVKVQGQQGRN